MKSAIFKALTSMNRIILPSYIYADLERLSMLQKAIIAYRIWVAKNTLK